MPLIVAAVACVAVVVALRCLSVRYGWTTAAEADYYPYVSRGARKVRDAAKGLIDRHRPSSGGRRVEAARLVRLLTALPSP